ncbi:MAG: flagellar motor switch protein FliM [Acidobacteria bacterium]|nr:flagellar motor switch protein FliM [Acidobacteriota bacterium]
MDKVLSQDEINALFSAMSSENVDLEASEEISPSERKVTKYDFHRADRISQDQMRSVHLMHEYFGRNFASSLSAYLRNFVDVKLVNLEQESYSAFLKGIPDPTMFSSIGMRPLDDNLALEMNPAVVFPMIDMILGGPGNAPTDNRNLTEIEMNIIDGVLRLAMRDLRTAWNPVIDLDLYLEDKGTKAQMFQIVSPGEAVIAIQLELKIGENSGLMNICIPSRVLKQLRSKFDQQWNVRRQKTYGNEEKRIVDLVKQVPILLTSEIRHSILTVDDLLKVSVGDVIELKERVEAPVYLCAGGIPKYNGRIILRRGKKAFEILEKCNHDG